MLGVRCREGGDSVSTRLRAVRGGDTMGQLICFRAFQGLGAGAVLPITFTIIGGLTMDELLP
jgi:MFS family permease